MNKLNFKNIKRMLYQNKREKYTFFSYSNGTFTKFLQITWPPKNLINVLMLGIDRLTFSDRNIRCSTTSVIRKMQIKTKIFHVLGNHVTSTKMANIRRKDNNKCW